MADTEPMVQAALSVVGAPYVWGATGPDSFDCSGLVVWSAAKAGITMTRTTYTQILEGEPVTGAPQRGDLVFPDAGHVGIALGGDTMVHAPAPGQNVKVEKYWTTPAAIRRVGTNSGLVGSTTVAPEFQSRGGDGPSLSDLIPDVSGLTDAVQSQYAFLSKIAGVMKAVGAFVNILMSTEGWTRILKVMFGTILVFLGIGFIAREFVGRML